MTKDKELEALFQAQAPRFDDGAEFMAKLTKRLDAVEVVKQYQERTLRRGRIVMAAAFVVGIVCGGLSVAWLQSSPAEPSAVSLHAPSGLLLWFARNGRLIASACLSMLMVFCTIAFMNNVLDIVEMCAKIRKRRV